MLLTLFFLVQTAFAQEQVDSTLTTEEIQFRDSIAAINTSNERMQLIQETYNAASSAFAESNFSKSISLFDEVIALDSSNADAFYNKGLAQKESKQYTEAVETLEQAFSLDATNFDALFHHSIWLVERVHQN